MVQRRRGLRAGWERRGVVVTLAALGILLVSAPADSQGGTPPPDGRETCPSQDENVVIREGRAYRWADEEVRLVSYQFKPGTFPANVLTFQPTYPQTKVDIDWGWGCLSVDIPECGQVDTTVIDFAPPGTLRLEDAAAALAGGSVLAGSAVLGTRDLCACPEPPPPPPPGGTEPALIEPVFTAFSGGPIEPEPCEPQPPG